MTYACVAAACAFAAAGVLAAPAKAEVALSLAGEDLVGGPNAFQTTATCNPDLSGTISYFVDGIAGGPYPGTFTESGTITTGPQVSTAGGVTAIDASFTIVSGTTIINGTKTIGLLPELNLTNQGVCLTTDAIYQAQVDSGVSYQATIDTATGTFQDSGRGRITAQDVHVAGSPPVDANDFDEQFIFSNGVVLVQTEAQVTGGGWIVGPTGQNISFGLTAQNGANGPKGNCTVIDHAAGVDVKCLTVDNVVQTATHAYFTGQAEVNGAVEGYRIDVDDLGEPGTADTFKIQTDSYAAAGVLAGGNIQIHQTP